MIHLIYEAAKEERNVASRIFRPPPVRVRRSSQGRLYACAAVTRVGRLVRQVRAGRQGQGSRLYACAAVARVGRLVRQVRAG